VLLCVDIGNTQISLGLYATELEEPGADSLELVRPPLVAQWRMRTDPRMTADELRVAINGMLGRHAKLVTGVAALSTVPLLLRELRLLAEQLREQVHSVLVEPKVRTGVPVLVDNPKEVGSDRVVNTLAAFRLFGHACVVVDFGTSTNIDVVSPRGELLGAAIAPGIEISADALAARAAALTTVELARPRSAIGKNTVECLQAGILFGFTGQVDGLVRRILVELESDYKVDPATVTVLATGGLAPLVVDESETISEHVPDLTLLGLRLVYLRSISRSASRAERATKVRIGSSKLPSSANNSGRPAK
jgi:type III pantothenate kinase